MKGILFLAAALFVSVQLIAAAGVRYRSKVWNAVQTYDVAVLSKNLEEHVRELAGMKCSFRGKDIRHPRPNWYQGSVWQPIAGQSGKFANVAVMVAKHDLAAFKSLPTDSSRAEIVLYEGAVVDPAMLWQISAEEHVTVFGTSPPFLRMCQSAGYSPRRLKLDLKSLRCVMSTGASRRASGAGS